MRVAKSGMKLSDKIDLVKKRRTTNNFINVDTKEIEWEPVMEFKNGGTIEWEPEIIIFEKGGEIENDWDIVFEIPSMWKTRTIEQLIEEDYSIDSFRDGGKTKEELETPEIEETT
jgi:hypothetical protein